VTSYFFAVFDARFAAVFVPFVAAFVAAFVAVFFAGDFRARFGAASSPAATLFKRDISRDLCRAAAFGWMTRRFAARSSTLIASRTTASASAPPSDTAVRAFLIAVRLDVRTALLRARWRSFWRQRLSADRE